MLVPLSWLTELLPLEVDPTDRQALRRLGEALDGLGLVVEHLEVTGTGLSGVVVARVAAIDAIKGADRIRRVLVDAGGPEPVEVVCGAWNFEVGDLVPLATVGTELASGMVIAERKMRGVTSRGMLCSPSELGLSADHAGIFILDPAGEPTLGMALAEHLELVPDAVFDLAIEPNRPDCLSLLGIARDLAARLGVSFRAPEPRLAPGSTPVGELAAIRIDAPDACERLVARVARGIEIVPSPALVQRRLRLAGMRAINAVVDASNYVMLELGQPTHAYDLATLKGSGIAIRRARAGEVLVTLDGVERRLGEGGALGIEDGECVVTDLEDTIVGLAGVMGGEESEVTASTSAILLEVAAFSPPAVAGTARRHGLRSEASMRFERGIDPEGLERAADRVFELVLEAARAGGHGLPEVANGTLDERAVAREPQRITLRTSRLNGVLGTALTSEQAGELLAPIGFTSTPVAEGLLVEVPSFRPDATLEVDVVEEVARRVGYEAMPSSHRRAPGVGRLQRSQRELRLVRRLLTGAGIDEAWGSSIVDPKVAERLGARTVPIGLANPMVAEESVLRAHLLPSLLEALSYNVKRRQEHIRLFEIGAVFAARPPVSPRPSAVQVGAWIEETNLLGVLLAGEGDDATAAVACWERLVEGLRLDPSGFALVQDRFAEGSPQHAGDEGATGALADDLCVGLHPQRSGRLVATTSASANRTGPVTFGALGEVDPELLARFSIDPSGRRVGALVVEIASLWRLPRRVELAQPVSRFPASELDLAFLVDADHPAAALVDVLRASGGDLVESLELLDVYRDEAFGRGARSVTVRVRLRALDRTLTDREIADARTSMVAAATERLGARWRGER